MPVVRRTAHNTSLQKTRAALLPPEQEQMQQQQHDSPPLFFNNTNVDSDGDAADHTMRQQVHQNSDNDDDEPLSGNGGPPPPPPAADSCDQVVIALSSLSSNSNNNTGRRTFGVAWTERISSSSISNTVDTHFTESVLVTTEFSLPQPSNITGGGNRQSTLSLQTVLSTGEDEHRPGNVDDEDADAGAAEKQQQQQQQQDPDPILKKALVGLLRSICCSIRRNQMTTASTTMTTRPTDDRPVAVGAAAAAPSSLIPFVGQTSTLPLPLSVRWLLNSSSSSSSSTQNSSSVLLSDVINSILDTEISLPEVVSDQQQDEEEEDDQKIDDTILIQQQQQQQQPPFCSAKLVKSSITFLSSREFNFSQLSVQRLASIITTTTHEQQQQQQQEQQLALLLSPQSTSLPARCALAAATSYFQRLGFTVAAIRSDPPLCVSHLHVPASTSVALQLSWLEAHPGAHHSLGRSKEGFSLLSVLSGLCATGLGRAAMRLWFSAPSSDAALLRQRHDAVAFLAQPQHREVFEALAAAVSRFQDPLPLFRRIASGQHTTLKDWQRLVASCNAAVQIAEVSNQLLSNDDEKKKKKNQQQQQQHHDIDNSSSSSFTMLHRIHSILVCDAAKEIESLIRHVVDFSQMQTSSSSSSNRRRAANNNNNTNHHNGHPNQNQQPQPNSLNLLVQQQQNTVRIRGGVDNSLDDYRRSFAELDNFLAVIAEQEVSQLKNSGCYSNFAANGNGDQHHGGNPLLQRQLPLTAVHFPQVGFLLHLPSSAIAAAGGLTAAIPSSWSLVLSAGDSCYFKNATMRKLDEEVGDLHAAVVRAEAEVRHQLDERVLLLARRAGLLGGATTVVVAELDCVLALAAKAQQEGWTRPKMVLDEPGFVSLRGCWHPLLSHHWLSAENAPAPCPYIELARASQPQQNLSSSSRSIIITGPNGSGKSALMRTVGVCVYLASIGSFVPAESASIGMFDAILTNDCLPQRTGVLGMHQQQQQQNSSKKGGKGQKRGKKNNNTSAAVANKDDKNEETSAVAAAAQQQQQHQLMMDTPVLRSSFGQEVSQVGAALSAATGATLLLFDEFGSGTLAEDGIALLGGVLAYCARLPPSRRPSLIATTHFTELLSSPSAADNDYLWLTMGTTTTTTTTTMHSTSSSRKLKLSRDENGDDSTVLSQQQMKRNQLAEEEDIFLFVPQPGSLHAASRCTVRIASRCGLPQSVVDEIASELLAL